MVGDEDNGFGGALLIDTTARAARAKSAIFALIVGAAKDEEAITFYEHHGFRRFASKPASLFLPIATALQALKAKPGK